MLGPRDLVLCSGTLLQASFQDMIQAAVAGGYKAITLWPHDYERARQGLSDADMRAMLTDNGLEIADLDPLLTWLPDCSVPEGIDGGIRFASEDEFYAIADAVGGRSLNIAPAFADQIDFDATVEAFAGVCDRAREHGLAVTLEFLPWTAIPDVSRAHEIVQAADRPNGGIMFDTWHFFRGAADLAELRAVAGERIGGVQLNDAPARPRDDLSDESMRARLLPGEGDIALVDIIRTLDAIGSQAPLGVEVFSEKLNALPATEVGRLSAEATRSVLAAARS